MGQRVRKRQWHSGAEYVEAAISLAARYGRDYLSTGRIAKALGKSHGGAVDHHFKRERGEREYLPAILRAAHESAWATVQPVFKDATAMARGGHSTLEVLHTILRHFSPIASAGIEDPRHRRLLFLAMTYRSLAIDYGSDRELMKFMGSLRLIIRHCQKSGYMVSGIRSSAIGEVIIGAFQELSFFRHVVELKGLGRTHRYGGADIASCMDRVIRGFLTERGQTAWAALGS